MSLVVARGVVKTWGIHSRVIDHVENICVAVIPIDSMKSEEPPPIMRTTSCACLSFPRRLKSVYQCVDLRLVTIRDVFAVRSGIPGITLLHLLILLGTFLFSEDSICPFQVVVAGVGQNVSVVVRDLDISMVFRLKGLYRLTTDLHLS